MSYIENVGVACVALYCFYIFIHGFALVRSKSFKKQTKDQRVTIIVPFRNERTTLPILLASFSKLSYPIENFEVILINDQSDDGSESIDVSGYPINIKVVHSTGEGKKAAITQGVQLAVNEIIVQTDADCEVPENWLTYLLGSFPEYDMMCGSVAFSNSIWQNLELFSYQGIGMASAHMKSPNLCNAANLAYKKDFFQSLNRALQHLECKLKINPFELHAF